MVLGPGVQKTFQLPRRTPLGYSLIPCQTINVLDKTLKGICDVRLDNRKVLCAPGLRIKYFELLCFCLTINYNITLMCLKT